MIQRMERASAAGAKGLIATLDWSFSMGRDWGSPEIPEKIDLKTMIRMAPEVITKPRWMWEFGRVGHIPDLKAPNLAPPAAETSARAAEALLALIGQEPRPRVVAGSSRPLEDDAQRCNPGVEFLIG